MFYHHSLLHPVLQVLAAEMLCVYGGGNGMCFTVQEDCMHMPEKRGRLMNSIATHLTNQEEDLGACTYRLYINTYLL